MFIVLLKVFQYILFLSDSGVPGVRSMGPDVRPFVCSRLFADFTDVTLDDEDSKSIPTDVAMLLAPPGGQH